MQESSVVIKNLLGILLNFISFVGLTTNETLVRQHSPTKIVPVHIENIKPKQKIAISSKTSVATKQNKTLTEPVETENKDGLLKIEEYLKGLGQTETSTNSVVNIYCKITKGNLIESVTGSGVVINSKGIVLTNAHVAEYVLLEDYMNSPSYSCNIRTGSPAKNSYKADVIYLSPTWVANNSNSLTRLNSVGTGANDYAFLRLKTSSQNNTVNPVTSSDISTEKNSISQKIILGGYPSENITADQLDKNLKFVSENSSITDLYGINGDDTKDLISTEATTLAQKGSSGGAIFSSQGILTGIMVATTLTDNGLKNIRGIALSYINQNLISSYGKTIYELINSADSVESDFKLNNLKKLSEILLSN